MALNHFYPKFQISFESTMVYSILQKCARIARVEHRISFIPLCGFVYTVKDDGICVCVLCIWIFECYVVGLAGISSILGCNSFDPAGLHVENIVCGYMRSYCFIRLHAIDSRHILNVYPVLYTVAYRQIKTIFHQYKKHILISIGIALVNVFL